MPPFLFTGARHADHQREFEVQITRGVDDPVRDFVAARNTAKDVNQDPLHPRIAGQQLQRTVHHFRLCPTADIEKISRMTPFALHQVKGVHHQPGAVADHTDRPVEPDVGQLATLGLGFQRIFV